MTIREICYKSRQFTSGEGRTRIHPSRRIPSTLTNRQGHFILDKLCCCQVRRRGSLERFWKACLVENRVLSKGWNAKVVCEQQSVFLSDAGGSSGL